MARPGDEVDVVGIFTNNFDMALNQSNGFPVFSTVIEANNVSLLKDGIGGTMLSHDDEHTVLITIVWKYRFDNWQLILSLSNAFSNQSLLLFSDMLM